MCESVNCPPPSSCSSSCSTTCLPPRCAAPSFQLQSAFQTQSVAGVCWSLVLVVGSVRVCGWVEARDAGAVSYTLLSSVPWCFSLVRSLSNTHPIREHLNDHNHTRKVATQPFGGGKSRPCSSSSSPSSLCETAAKRSAAINRFTTYHHFTSSSALRWASASLQH